MRTPQPSPGSEQLGEWMKTNSKKVGDLADELGVKRESIWRWLNGQRVPTMEICFKIERLTGIPATAWLAEKASA